MVTCCYYSPRNDWRGELLLLCSSLSCHVWILSERLIWNKWAGNCETKWNRQALFFWAVESFWFHYSGEMAEVLSFCFYFYFYFYFYWKNEYLVADTTWTTHPNITQPLQIGTLIGILLNFTTDKDVGTGKRERERERERESRVIHTHIRKKKKFQILTLDPISILDFNESVASVIRIFRLARILRLIKSAKNLRYRWAGLHIYIYIYIYSSKYKSGHLIYVFVSWEWANPI